MLQEAYSKTIAVIWSSCCRKSCKPSDSCNLRTLPRLLGQRHGIFVPPCGGLQPSEAMGEAFGTGSPLHQRPFTQMGFTPVAKRLLHRKTVKVTWDDCYQGTFTPVFLHQPDFTPETLLHHQYSYTRSRLHQEPLTREAFNAKVL